MQLDNRQCLLLILKAIFIKLIHHCNYSLNFSANGSFLRFVKNMFKLKPNSRIKTLQPFGLHKNRISYSYHSKAYYIVVLANRSQAVQQIKGHSKEKHQKTMCFSPPCSGLQQVRFVSQGQSLHQGCVEGVGWGAAHEDGGLRSLIG